ncbi:MAG TPA: hypothetical protein VGN29_20585, partial [Solirubrobacteraceae bacterium]|nr:hypothetical protein [Solirubrobacteraceae bacterium]
VILVFVLLGNSASGGPFARPLLPGLWRTTGGVLPPGAGVDLARSRSASDPSSRRNQLAPSTICSADHARSASRDAGLGLSSLA